MPIYKCIEYSIFCENYLECNNFEDFEKLNNTPKKYFKKLGYREINGIWYCSKCYNKMEGKINANKKDKRRY